MSAQPGFHLEDDDGIHDDGIHDRVHEDDIVDILRFFIRQVEELLPHENPSEEERTVIFEEAIRRTQEMVREHFPDAPEKAVPTLEDVLNRDPADGNSFRGSERLQGIVGGMLQGFFDDHLSEPDD